LTVYRYKCYKFIIYDQIALFQAKVL